MVIAKNGNVIYKNRKEVSEEFNRRAKPLIDKAIADYHANVEKAKDEATKEALMIMLPIACTALHEAHGFGETRLEKFVEYFKIHMQCVDEGVTDIAQYHSWCKDQGYKFFDVVQVELTKEVQNV